MTDESGFHEGERAMQACAGETAIANRNIALLSDTVIAGARPFIARQFMAALASVDAAGAVWASVVFGQPGFVQTPDAHSIRIDVPEQERDHADPVWTNLASNPDVGMLFIELASRRRYRVNGIVRRLDDEGAEVAIREAYPNCPKYIQRRQLRHLGEARLAVQTAQGTVLLGAVQDIVARADTVFVASHAANGADASHRGGPAGFVRRMDDTTLRIPDYAGNSLFNTLGNFKLDARAGLCILDFEQGRILQLTGSATVKWNQDDPGGETAGTHRFWEFKVERWILRDNPHALAWEYLDASPFNPATYV